MPYQMAPLALTWNDMERSKSRSRICRRAVTWKRLQIGPWLHDFREILGIIRESLGIIREEGGNCLNIRETPE